MSARPGGREVGHRIGLQKFPSVCIYFIFFLKVVFQLEKRQEKVVTLISLKDVVVNKTRVFEKARERCPQSPAQCPALK